jgi:fatty-acid peroxygenase
MARSPPTPEPPLPRAPEFDSTLALLREGYGFGAHRCTQLRSDVFATRVASRPVVFARGADAAAMFYHPGRFTRRGALPPTTLVLLQDFGSVQQLDGDRHLQRKAMFLRLLDAAATARMVGIFREEWDRQAELWEGQHEVVLHPQVEEILCRTVCRWAGVPLPEADAPRRARELAAMIDGAGAFGPRFVRGWWKRRSTERWIRGVIGDLRDRPSAAEAAPVASPAATVALHRGPDGALLDLRTAAVELINLLRPTVAVARWVTFAAVALHQHPSYLPRLRAREPRLLQHFAQEVRRFYPFFPVIGGRVREPFEWRGRRFERGEWVILDLHGTNHDPQRWAEPQRFDPDRFHAWGGSAHDFVPQGAGDVTRGHRCPGENPSIALLMTAIDSLATRLEYDVPEQDLGYRMNRFPSIPESRFVMRNVRRTG